MRRQDRNRLFAHALLAAALLAEPLTACAPSTERDVLGALQAQLANQYHECVPLGWTPVPVAGTYYPGTSVTLYEQGVWLPALWIGRVRTRDLARPDVRMASDVLNALARAGMLVRTKTPGGTQYHLTTFAQPFFYDDNAHGNNPDHVPYLCYSTIVPRRVVSTDSVRRERLRYGWHDEQVFHASFEWTASPVAGWANDTFIRSHSVTLGPAENPVTATLVNHHGAWVVAELTAPTPFARIVNASVWPRPRR